ncbi:MAG: hypothetical protein WA633_04560 [Stellaceae bacterium]
MSRNLVRGVVFMTAVAVALPPRSNRADTLEGFLGGGQPCPD